MNKTIHNKRLLVDIFSSLAIALFILTASTFGGNSFPQRKTPLSFLFYKNNIKKTQLVNSETKDNPFVYANALSKAGKEITLNN
jgi:hypothetical protein